MKEKHYIVVNLTETDGDCFIRRLTGEQIRNLERDDRESCAIIDGNVIKGFENYNFDFRRLK